MKLQPKILERAYLMNANRNKYRDLVEEMLSLAGISIDGNRAFDIQVKDDRFYKTLIRDGSLGLGESFMEGWWECDRIDELATKLFRANLIKQLNKNLKFIFYSLKAKLSPFGKKSRAFEVGESHYDLGNDIYQVMLDKRMAYTCGYWKDAKSLDQAQENKLELICQKIGLKPGMRVLDLGCGFGCFAKYAAEKYDVEVVGVTVSKEQVKLGRELCSGLSVELRLQDYRDVNETFDRIVAIGLLEHVSHKYYRKFMETVHRCLKDEGLFLLHNIGRNNTLSKPDHPWINKYIFPNSEIPSVKQIAESIEGLFVMEDWHNFGTDYDKTIMEWYKNFVNGWDKLKSRYDERFFRMWKFYLLIFVGAYRSRYLHLWQTVLSKKGIPGGYQKNISYKYE